MDADLASNPRWAKCGNDSKITEQTLPDGLESQKLKFNPWLEPTSDAGEQSHVISTSRIHCQTYTSIHQQDKPNIHSSKTTTSIVDHSNHLSTYFLAKGRKMPSQTPSSPPRRHGRQFQDHSKNPLCGSIPLFFL